LALASFAYAGEGQGLAFRVGKIVTVNATNSVVNNAVLLVKDGLIEKVGKANEVAIPEGYRVINKPDVWLVPGLVDCHNHTAGSLSDLNDMVYLTNPGLRTMDTVEPDSSRMKMARAGGVTTVLLLPGSGTNLSGFGTLCKTAGHTVDEVVMRSPGSLKIAQAGNPERYWWRVGRMMMNYNTRQTLAKARKYYQAVESYTQSRDSNGAAATPPEFNLFFDDFRGLFEQKYPVTVHTQIYQVVMTTVDMLARKFKIRTVLDHSTFDGWKVAPLVLATEGIYTVNGPRQYHFDRTQRKIHGNAARWWQGGVHNLSINTDAPVIPEQELSFQAAMACYYGWKPYQALRGLTRIPAEAMMVDDKVGSIEVGKQADFGLWTGDPLDPRSWCKMTIVNGKIAYDSAKHRRF